MKYLLLNLLLLFSVLGYTQNASSVLVGAAAGVTAVEWFDAGNGGSTMSSLDGTTFARTSSTVGTFTIPDGVEPKEFIIYHTAGQNPGTSYKIRFNYAGTIDYNNNFTDIRMPDVDVGNAYLVVLNSGVATDTYRYVYSKTTGTANLEKSITGFIDDFGYFEVTLDNVSSVGGNDIVIKVTF